MAQLTPAQQALQRRIEGVIALLAPVLDVALFAGEQISRVAGRNELPPEPSRRLAGRPARTPLGGPPDGAH